MAYLCVQDEIGIAFGTNIRAAFAGLAKGVTDYTGLVGIDQVMVGHTACTFILTGKASITWWQTLLYAEVTI